MAIGARFAAQGLDAFAQDDGDHDEGGDGIGPPPAEGGIEDEAAEQDGGEPGAEVGLAGVGDEGGAVEPGSDAALGAGEEWHDDQ